MTVQGTGTPLFFHTYWFGFYYEENCSYMYDPQQISVFWTFCSSVKMEKGQSSANERDGAGATPAHYAASQGTYDKIEDVFFPL